jgi:hypothetical protein
MTLMDRTEITVRKMLTAVEAPVYDIGVLSDRGMLPGLDSIPAAAVLDRLSLLKYRNARGSHISNLHFHGPVGAVGHQSTGTISVIQQWITSAPEPDWSVVAEAFREAAANKAKAASSSEEYLTVAALAKAQEQAIKKDKTGFLDTVSKLGQSALPVLASAGAHGLVSYLEQHLNWKLT